MCKLLIIPSVGATKKLQDLTRRFIIQAQPYLNKDDGHGFGIMTYGDGGLRTEKWLNPSQAFRIKSVSKKTVETEEKYLGFLSAVDSYRSTGAYNKKIYSLVAHSRFATSEICISNTHPFVSGDTALCHNGVVNTGNLHMVTSSCDSEGILNSYVSNKVNEDISNINLMTKSLDGYYALGIFSVSSGTPILDVIKDGKASLEAMYIPMLRTIVFCTKISIVKQTLKKLGWKQGTEFELEDNIIMRHNAITGEVIGVTHFTPAEKKYATWSASTSSVIPKPAWDDEDDFSSNRYT